MQTLNEFYKQLDLKLTKWMSQYGISALRISLGIVFIWFGSLKFIPGLSPAQDLATRTMQVLSFGLIQPNISIALLAIWECLIGIGLLFSIFLRITLLLLFVQMLGTIMPLFFFPEEIFSKLPYAPTLEGQYIIKNLVIISAGLVIGATVRGGKITPGAE
ncbi:MAG: DoxX family protein [Candidatus Neomarinimicrobiota bacterium]